MKFILSLLIVSSVLLIPGCLKSQSGNITEETQTTYDVRKIAWDSLTESQKEEVIGDWKDTEVTQVIAERRRFHLDESAFEEKEVTMVTFRSSRSALLGDISILIDEKSQKVIGVAYRE